MFKKILIANRGEIACRVMATARKLGVKTVAVYSDADAQAKHVQCADEAVYIGSSAVAQSYLLGDKIIAAALQTGAQAIHPGYGFLSENPDFVEAVEAAGLVFVGPPASAIHAMGLKDAAKDLMVKAGVPVVPGYHGGEQDADFLAAQADEIGYPVLIKARAGGGGKGMRLVEDPADFKAALEGAQREGQASFGDPSCLIEKYILQPRHIEIQVFGDGHGNAIHLFERDCSLQRRHQKVIEEAPAPDMPATVRTAMGKAAVDAAKAISYSGAGTVEFIVDGSGALREDGFWFMEMNTRLQVEHPVTEAITGLDLVRQEDLSINGWSFEARVYAEDVPKGFLPATGTLDHLRFPEGAEFSEGAVRIDSGVRQGDTISPWYDPMIAKVIVHGPTRAAALNMLTTALENCQVAGSVTNLEFLTALSRHDGFGKGEVDTGLIGRDLDALVATASPSANVLALAALGGLDLVAPVSGNDPFERLSGWRQWDDATQFVSLTYAERRIDAQVTQHGKGQFSVTHDGETVRLGVIALDGTAVRVELADRVVTADLLIEPARVSVFADGRSYSFDLIDPLAGADTDQEGGDTVVAPMPGLVQAVLTEVGTSVAKGDALLVLEAMKMEHTLTAPRDGVVAEISVTAGDQVTDGSLLLALEPADD